MKNTMTRFAILLLLSLVFTAGCGSKLKPVTGKVTYDGQPLKSGVITFVPDFSKGNNGGGTAAEIIDGEYTLSKRFGIIGGAYHVTVSGNDGVVAEDFPVGKPLFGDYKIDHDFKDGETTFDVDVPKKR
ncbi:MAG: hypothetical protein LBQ54_10320 [Planctomycetaceae bacterium]|jgi:hypothetical protein|nr:hypothetical protein [Planctomycetaceae bacterium]